MTADYCRDLYFFPSHSCNISLFRNWDLKFEEWIYLFLGSTTAVAARVHVSVLYFLILFNPLASPLLSFLKRKKKALPLSIWVLFNRVLDPGSKLSYIDGDLTWIRLKNRSNVITGKREKPIQEQMKNEKPTKNFTSLENEKIKEKIVKKNKGLLITHRTLSRFLWKFIKFIYLIVFDHCSNSSLDANVATLLKDMNLSIVPFHFFLS